MEIMQAVARQDVTLAEEEERIHALRREIDTLREQEALASMGDTTSGLYDTMTTNGDGGPAPWEIMSASELADLERRINEVRKSCEELASSELHARMQEAACRVAEYADMFGTGELASELKELERTEPLSPTLALMEQASSADVRLMDGGVERERLSVTQELTALDTRSEVPTEIPEAQLAVADTPKSAPATELSHTAELDALLRDMDCIEA
jgi:hypothetical protein